MSESRKIKVVKKKDIDEQQHYQRRHELSLLKLLVEKHPKEARKIVEKAGKTEFCVV